MEARDYIAAIRKKGLTQAQIAERTGIPQPSISKIERGDVSDVMSRNYRALQSLYEEEVVNAPAEPPAASTGRAKRPLLTPSPHREPRQDIHRDKPSNRKGR